MSTPQNFLRRSVKRLAGNGNAELSWLSVFGLKFMTKHVPLMLFALAVVSIGLTFFGGEYARLESIKASLVEQRQANVQLHETVVDMKRDATLLQTDARALEKAARSELGMARPGEVIVFFGDNEQVAKKSDATKNEKRKPIKSGR